MQILNRARVLAAFVALVLAGIARAGETEHWFRVLISDAPAGWMRSSEVEADGKITSQAEMTFRLRRGPIDIAIAMNSEFVETSEGKPVSMKLHQEMSATPVDSKYTFTPDGIEVETTQSGQTTKTKRPIPSGEWLCPAAGGRQLRDRLAKGEKEIVLSTIDPLGGLDVVKMTHRVVGPDTVVIEGKPVKVTKATVETSQMPGIVSTEYIDDAGIAIRSDTAMGGMKMSLIKAGPEVRNQTGPAPELMISTFVKPDQPIANPRKTSSATYLLSIPEGEMPKLPGTSAQKVEIVDATRARLSVDTSDPAPAPAAEAADITFLASTTAANIEDPTVKKLATRALKDAPEGKAERAEKLRRFVYSFIKKKSLDVGFATASETARTKAGDCSEHGVLLAALLRADGIPSRVAVGVLYVDDFAGESGIFGYHMWAQALLDKDGQKRWVDLDATLPNGTPFDATHIALGVSDLSDQGGMESMAGLLNVIGKLSIKVESVK